MNNKLFIPIILVVILIGGIWYFISMGNKPMVVENSTEEAQVTSEPTTAEAQTSETPPEKKTYTLAEIAEHGQESDCWFAIDGKVYDVTEYIAANKHPGAKAIIEGCGKDATELFNTRPMGSKTPHSDKARGFLPNFQIGILRVSE